MKSSQNKRSKCSLKISFRADRVLFSFEAPRVKYFQIKILTITNLANAMGSCERQSCECDMAFAITLSTLKTPNNQNTNGEICFVNVISSGNSDGNANANTPANGDCCQQNGLMTWFSAQSQQCCPEGTIKNFGELC